MYPAPGCRHVQRATLLPGAALELIIWSIVAPQRAGRQCAGNSALGARLDASGADEQDRPMPEPTKKVVVVGQGYVGLPLAMRAVEVGYEVVGFDIDPRRVELLATATSYVEDVSSEQLEEALASGRYFPTIFPARIAGFDVALITVPTPLREGGRPFLRHGGDERLGGAPRTRCPRGARVDDLPWHYRRAARWSPG